MTKFFKFLTNNNSYLLLVVYCGIAGLLIRFQDTLSLKSLQSRGTEFRASISGLVSDIGEYFSLKRENEKLTLQNASLLADAIAGANALRDSAKVAAIAELADRHPGEFLTARVVERRFNTTENFLLVNAGSKLGVRPDMPVLTPDGLAGRVVQVSENYAKVMPVIHSDFSVSVVSDSNMTHGLLRWDGKRERIARMDYVALSSSIAKGEKLYTTDFSTFALRGIPVGEIIEVTPGKQFFNVAVRLAVDFSSLTHVMIAESSADPEKIELMYRPVTGEDVPQNETPE